MRLDVSRQRGYEIAAALRGPDFPGGGILKEIFTARIRTLAGVSAEVPAAARGSRIGDWVVDELRNRCQTPLPSGAYHYLSHIMRAAAFLKDKKLERLAEIVNEASLADFTNKEIIDLAGGE